VRVLVATDCLSEGINLQDHFDAVIHADIPWNPNRLEQREGRIDRFGQSKATVETVLLYSADNAVDQVVLDVLVRKARAIRRDLGVAVPVAVEAEQVVQAVVDSVLLGQVHPAQAQQLSLFAQEETSRFHAEWDRAVAREKRFRAYFAQHGILGATLGLGFPLAFWMFNRTPAMTTLAR
jgi:superfamily II DNA/RNA helicase